jgi:uncharacterized protein
MQLEWDPKKAKGNINKHNVSFDEALTVFYDPLSATFDDPDHSSDERRLITIGYSSKNNLLVVAYVERKERIRFISARIATKNEMKKHEK